MKKLLGVAALALFGLSFCAALSAQTSTAQGIEAYRQALQDGNPSELLEARGEGIWQEKRGTKQVSLAGCDLGLGAGIVKGAYAKLPRYFADVDAVMNLETRLVHCMVNLQGIERASITKAPFSRDGERQTDIEALVAYVVAESKGMKVAISQAHAKEQASYKRGEQIFWFRGGPYDFSCASCHSEDKQRIRLQDLPNLLNKGQAQSAYTSWPAYRVSQGAVRTFEWRLYDCFRQQRFPELLYNSQAAIDLTTFLAVNANEGVLTAPGIKR